MVLAGNVLAFVEGTESFSFRGLRASCLLNSDLSPNTRVEGAGATRQVPPLTAGSDGVFGGSWLSGLVTCKAGVLFFNILQVTTGEL